MDLARFNKFWVALVGVIILIVGEELGTDSKWYTYAIAILAAIGVFLFPNKTDA